MVKKSYVSILLAVAVGSWAVLLLLQGVSLRADYLRPFGIVAGVLVALIGAFELFLWRLPFLHSWFVPTPDLNGTWAGTMDSTWAAEEGAATKSIPATIVVRQTFSRITLSLRTAESGSVTLTCSLLDNGDRTFQLSGVFRNTPDLSVRDRSEIHHGAFLLTIGPGRRPTSLFGEYWTDRDTKGEMTLNRA